MNDGVKNVSGGGLGLGGIVFVILLVLKLTGNLAMGWFGVITSILWAPILATFAIFGLFLIVFAIVFVLAVISKIVNKRMG